MLINILIADDEPHICAELESILQQIKYLNIVSICHSGDEALDQICQLKPDLVFLDINMPGLDGIKLGRFLKQTNLEPYIIYLTAYDKFALEAFKVGAKGYLLKPFIENDILEQINIAKDYITKINDKKIEIEETANHVCGKINDKIIPIELKNLVAVFSKDRIVYLKSNDKEYTSNLSLTQLKSKFNSNDFFQCHRSFIVNLYNIKEVIPWFNGTYMLVMNDKENTRVPVSRNYVKALREKLNL